MSSWTVAALLLTSAAAFGASPAPTNSPSQREYLAFKPIPDKNIFNSERSRRSGRNSGETRRSPRADTMTLVGTMSYEKGHFAFFDGSASEFKKALEAGKKVAGCTVAEISAHGVKLEIAGKTVEVPVGTQLRREEGGEWQVINRSESAVAPTASSTDSPGEESDIIQKLMQQREQELK